MYRQGTPRQVLGLKGPSRKGQFSLFTSVIRITSLGLVRDKKPDKGLVIAFALPGVNVPHKLKTNGGIASASGCKHPGASASGRKHPGASASGRKHPGARNRADIASGVNNRSFYRQ